MRKYAIVQEFKNISKPGTYIMKEKTNFLCGKMMDIEDEIRISYNFTHDEIYNSLNPPIQLSTQEISDINNSVMNINNMSYDNIKKNKITLIEDPTQSTIDSNGNTKWIFQLDSNGLLLDYLYNEIYTLNPHSQFKQIPLNLSPSNSINELCINYIKENILDRYRIKEFILWTKYYELKLNNVPGISGAGINNVPLLYKTPQFSLIAIPNENIDKNKETISMKKYIDDFYDISYKQTKSSQFYTFLYYFDVIYEKI